MVSLARLIGGGPSRLAAAARNRPSARRGRPLEDQYLPLDIRVVTRQWQPRELLDISREVVNEQDIRVVLQLPERRGGSPQEGRVVRLEDEVAPDEAKPVDHEPRAVAVHVLLVLLHVLRAVRRLVAKGRLAVDPVHDPPLDRDRNLRGQRSAQRAGSAGAPARGALPASLTPSFGRAFLPSLLTYFRSLPLSPAAPSHREAVHPTRGEGVILHQDSRARKGAASMANAPAPPSRTRGGRGRRTAFSK
eukprot:CAMPEP_0177616304 /NCGR_PEP_ID=MMETSP0419_2-20121207/24053_1 /TAXON_ID=582737 /ORGANISM="Tetraselmis sp., Strain GSL018" /LENGTH=247 /DNA_ID=CAMNT_0019114291 /DNA_START=230 /DNA_END=974 /DNA_ORIENTATION=-